VCVRVDAVWWFVTRERIGCSAAAVIVALWLSESASCGGFSFSAPKCEFLGPTKGNNHVKKTSEDSGLRMAKKTVAVEVKCAVETTSRHLYVQRTRRGRERRAEEEKSANCPATKVHAPCQQRNAREPRGAYPARAEMDFGIGIVSSQEAASFPHTLKVNM
jgi:hypothetical protein